MIFLPLVGRRHAGVKFYRLILIISGGLVLAAAASHALARVTPLLAADAALLAGHVILIAVLRYPKRFIYRLSFAALALGMTVVSILAFERAVQPSSLLWSIVASVTSLALLGSINLAMLLGHWYLVVRGMPIDPLKRLTALTLLCAILKIAVVGGALLSLASLGWERGSPLHQITVTQGIFFWMRVGWGLVAPLALFPMIWGTVKLRSTMAATGILYVDVVAVVIGEVLGGYLSAMFRLPL